jgi:hypothetical protein
MSDKKTSSESKKLRKETVKDLDAPATKAGDVKGGAVTTVMHKTGSPRTGPPAGGPSPASPKRTTLGSKKSGADIIRQQ